MLWDMLVIFFIIAFSYAFAFREDVPNSVLIQSLVLMLLILVALNITSIIDYLAIVLSRNI